jgi:hypothetical protein
MVKESGMFNRSVGGKQWFSEGYKGSTNRASNILTGSLTDRKNGFTGGLTNGVNKDPIQFVDIGKLRNSRHKRGQLYGFTVLFVSIMLISTIFFIHSNPTQLHISTSIDNNYLEWSNLTNIGFANFGVKEKENALYMTLERDNILQGYGNVTESYLIFIDIMDQNTGYHLGYGSYEYYIDIYGYNHTITQSRGYQYDGKKNQSDWNGFSSRYSSFAINCANIKDQMEFSLRPIQLGLSNISGLTMLIYHFDTQGNYEYSQILDVDVIKQVELSSDEGTRSEPKISYYHIFEKNELHITTENSLAYMPIPYVIRVITPQIETPTAQSHTLQPNQQQVPNNNYSERDMATTLTISYEFWENDVIRQCGGHVYNTTLNNYSLSDSEIVIYNMNRSVSGITIKGDFGTKHIQEKELGSGIGILSVGELPPNPSQTTGNNSHLTVRQTHHSITIDGSIDYASHGEWYPSEYYYVDVSSNDIYVGVAKDYDYLYIYIDNYDQSSDDSGDFGEVYFDLWNYGNTSPNNSTYKKFRCYSDDTLNYWEGSSSGWATATTPSNWAGANTYYGGSTDRQKYEFKIPLGDLSVSDRWDNTNDEIGFGAYAVDDGFFSDEHTWYPTHYYSGVFNPSTQYNEKPDTWGNLIYRNWTQSILQDGAITPPTIDGILNESEWSDYATYYTYTDTNTMSFYFMANDTYFWRI